MDSEIVQECLARIVSSDSFSRSPQAKRFLQYVVLRTLEGQGQHLKAYTIGVAALGVNDERSRPETTARMQASRVRKLLLRYYEAQGRADPIRFELPPGTYEPRFSWCDEPESTRAVPSDRNPTLVLAGFDVLSVDSGDAQFCRGVSDALITLLVRADDLRVTQVPHPGVQSYVLKGTLSRSGETIRLVCTLDGPEGDTVWSERYDRVLGFGDFLPIQDELALLIANQLGDPAVGAIARASRRTARHGAMAAAMQAFFRFLASPSTGNLDATRALLEAALAVEQGQPVVHAAYSCVLALHYLGAPSGRGTELLSAEAHARAASSLDSECSLAHLAKAFVHYHQRERACVERECRRAVERATVSPIVRAIAGNLLCLVGTWEEGLDVIGDAQRSSPQFPGYLYLGRALYHFHRQGDAARALHFVELLELEPTLLSTLLSSACLMQLGRTVEARRTMAQLVSRDRTIGRRLPRQLSDMFFDNELCQALLAAARDGGLSVRMEPRVPAGRYQVSRTTRPTSSEVRVGLLHSLSGTMAISETHLVNAAMLAIDELNTTGGVLGRPIRGIVADGASDPEVFRDRAERLIEADGVACIFGCWTSSSRKAVLPVVERNNSLLWYPVQYEGLERSRNIIYTGSCLNQQIEPAVRWATKQDLTRCFLVGSDYVFPRTANRLIRGLVEAAGGEIIGERYEPLGAANFQDIARRIAEAQPDIVYNTVNGADNISLFAALRRAGVRPERSPVMSFSFSELELAQAGDLAVGHLACWSYFQSMEAPENFELVRRFQGRYGESEVLSDPTVTAHAQMHLWRDVVSRAGSLETDAVLAHLVGSRMRLGGEILEVVENNHVHRAAVIGRARPDRQFDVIWRSNRQIAPQPWLGVDEVEFLARDLVLGALRALPEMAEKNASLEGQMARLLS